MTATIGKLRKANIPNAYPKISSITYTRPQVTKADPIIALKNVAGSQKIVSCARNLLRVPALFLTFETFNKRCRAILFPFFNTPGCNTATINYDEVQTLQAGDHR